MSFGAITKYVGGAIQKYAGSSAASKPSAPHVKTHGYDNEIAGLFQAYYGLNLSEISKMTPEQLGQLRDAANQSKWLKDNIDLIEDIVNDYIEGQIGWQDFVGRATKKGLAGAEKIDKATTDMMLALLGYKTNSKMQGHRVDNEKKLLDKELEDFIDLENYSLDAAFKANALKLKKKKEEINTRPDLAEAEEALRMEAKLSRDYIQALLKYGTEDPKTKSLQQSQTTQSPQASNPIQNFQNFWNGVGDWLSGK